ncbi:Hsp20/alpha crystallin family protein [Lactiplantibacillus plajomi]|uniref:Hsp20/alpha crystallin family protein n=1 Tax=Lactiplantibacillus plajomi TaxID=1457217 RepID=A0ABV6K131_9LACO|nr:Hsp20/alpha crystallin family protein [Lactiplantibacillus plajomi]
MFQFSIKRQLKSLWPVQLASRTKHDVENAVNSLLVMRTDVVAHDDAYTVTAELPGFDKEDITVTYRDDALTITASQSSGEVLDDDGRILRRERRASRLTRRFRLTNVVADRVSAHYHGGLLTVTLPKKVRDQAGHIEIQ